MGNVVESREHGGQSAGPVEHQLVGLVVGQLRHAKPGLLRRGANNLEAVTNLFMLQDEGHELKTHIKKA